MLEPKDFLTPFADTLTHSEACEQLRRYNVSIYDGKPAKQVLEEREGTVVLLPRDLVAGDAVQAQLVSTIERLGSYAAVAAAAGVSDEYVRLVAHGKRTPGGHLLRYLGYEKVICFRPTRMVDEKRSKLGARAPK